MCSSSGSSSPRPAWWSTPFLPGDSLLFAVGAVAASPGSPINFWLVCVLLVVAAVARATRSITPSATTSAPRSSRARTRWLLNKKHLLEAHEFYERYGGVTIILARFMPIIRTFAPFVAGIGKMTYRRVRPLQRHRRRRLGAPVPAGGWWFGGREIVQKNFKLVIWRSS